jgi:hypothetical protein
VLLGPGALHHNIPQRLGVLLGPLLVDAEKKLGIKRQTDRKGNSFLRVPFSSRQSMNHLTYRLVYSMLRAMLFGFKLID